MRYGLGMAMLGACLLAACGSGEDKGVGGVTADEAAQLNDAAEMLDASPDGLAAPEGAPVEGESDANENSAGGNAS